MQHALLLSVAQTAFVLCERWVSVADVDRALCTYFLHCLSSASFESGVSNELNIFLKSILNRTRFFQFRMQLGFIFLVMRLVRWSVMP